MNGSSAVWFIFVIVAIVVNFFIASLIAKAAEEKGRSFNAFFWLSFLFSWLIMAIVLALLPPLNQEVISNNSSLGEGRALRECPKCAEPILAKASFCKHCRNEVLPLETSN